MKKLLLSLTAAMIATSAKASEPPSVFTFQGRILKSNGVDPVTDPSVLFKLQIRSPDGLCLLFEETHLRDMTGTSGVFSIVVGQGINTNVSSLNLLQTFDNATSKIGAAGCAYTPGSGDSRKLRMSFDNGVEVVSLAMDQNIVSVPYAMNSLTLQGLTKDRFLQVSSQSNQSKLDDVLSMTTQLLALANGSGSQYVKSSDLPISAGVVDLSGGGLKLPLIPAGSQYAVSKLYADSHLGGFDLNISGMINGQTLSWNAPMSRWDAVSAPAGTITSVIAGPGLSGGTITSSGTISLATTGTPGTYTKVTTDLYGRITAGTAITASDLPLAGGDLSGPVDALIVGRLQGVQVSSTAPTNNQVLTFNSSNSRWEAQALPTTSVSSGGTGQSFYTNGQILIGNMAGGLSKSTITAGSGVTITNGDGAITVSLNAGTSIGQNLRWNGSAWIPGFSNFTDLRSAAMAQQFPTTCSNAQTLAYQTPSDTFACVTISINTSQVVGLGSAALLNVGSIAGTVAAGNDSRLTGALQSTSTVGGDLDGVITGPTVAKIQGISISSSPPSDGQVLKYSATSAKWEAQTIATSNGTVTNISSGSGLTGGPISTTGTLSVDTGTTANKIVKLDSSARLPAVDGSQLTNLPQQTLPPFSNFAVYDVSGTWTVPAGITRVYVQAWGGGGGGGPGTLAAIAGAGGGAGGYGAILTSVTPGNSITVTVGAGGTAGPLLGVGGAGGTTSFGVLLSATGGSGGAAGATGPTAGGTSTAAINISGGKGNGGGALAVIAAGGMGGSAGGGGGPGGGGSSSGGSAGGAGSVPGGGGGGGGNTAVLAAAGGVGGSGRVVIWW